MIQEDKVVIHRPQYQAANSLLQIVTQTASLAKHHENYFCFKSD